MEEEIFREYFFPAIYGYTSWVLEEAEKRGIKRIYFLARDMWQSYHMARRITEERASDIEIRYIHVSRMSLKDERAADYLAQEGLQDDIPIAIADSGWLGTMQLKIEKLCNRPVEGFYFGLYRIPKKAERYGYHGYYFMPHGHLKRKVDFSNSLFEAVCSSPEGMTVGYLLRGERLEPIKSRVGNPNEKSVIRYRALADEIDLPDAVSIEDIDKKLSRLMSEPTMDEIGAIGDLRFSDKTDESRMESIAVNWTPEEYRDQRLFQKIRLKLSGKRLHESPWPFASFIRNEKYRPIDLKGERVYRYLMYMRMELV